MIDELKAFSKNTKFDLILLRKTNDNYKVEINSIIDNGVNLHVRPFSKKFIIKKALFSLRFALKNLKNFGFNYNGVIGLKSIVWFCFLDINLFDENSSIHAQFATQPAIISLMIKQYYQNKPEYSFTFHAYDIYFKNNWFNTLVKNAKWAFSISEYNIKYVKENYGLEENIILSRLGVNIPNSSKKLHIEKSVIKLGFLSWFVEKKGVFYLLNAVKKLAKKDVNNFHLTIAGDGPLKERIICFIKENDLEANIEYIGKLQRSDKESFFKSIDIFILPSISVKNDMDGIPVVLMEAISFGIPIISTKISGIPEICIDGYNGKLIREKSIDDIVEAVKIFTDISYRKQLSINCLKMAKKYDIEENSIRKINLLSW